MNEPAERWTERDAREVSSSSSSSRTSVPSDVDACFLDFGEERKV
jgi:hypothetical protein